MAETGGRVVQHGCQSGSRVSRTLRRVFGWLDAAVTDVCVEREWIRFNEQITIVPLEMTSNSFGASKRHHSFFLPFSSKSRTNGNA